MYMKDGKKNPTEKQYDTMPEVWGVEINPHKANVKITNLYSKYIKNNIMKLMRSMQIRVVEEGCKEREFELGFEK